MGAVEVDYCGLARLPDLHLKSQLAGSESLSATLGAGLHMRGARMQSL
jgi:hypothetical protein